MNKKNNSTIFIWLVIVAFVAVAGFLVGKKYSVKPSTIIANPSPEAIPSSLSTPLISSGDSNGLKTFQFHNFHGVDLGDAGFEFQYPADWYNDNQYFSPQKIKYYDIISSDAPVYYDLVSEDIFDTSDLRYQIITDKRHRPDTTVIINGKTFKKYDLIDYQSDGSNRVIIFLGPKISIYGDSYYFVFRWEEKPLTKNMPGNSIEVFDNMLLSLKFFK